MQLHCTKLNCTCSLHQLEQLEATRGKKNCCTAARYAAVVQFELTLSWLLEWDFLRIPGFFLFSNLTFLLVFFYTDPLLTSSQHCYYGRALQNKREKFRPKFKRECFAAEQPACSSCEAARDTTF